MQTIAQITSTRASKVLIADKQAVGQNFVELLKSDVYNLLSSYLKLNKDAVFVNFNIGQNGKYNLSITAQANYIKNVGLMPK